MARTVDEYMKLPYRLELVEDPDEGGYVALYPDLPGCLTVGETVEKAIGSRRASKATRDSSRSGCREACTARSLSTHSGKASA